MFTELMSLCVLVNNATNHHVFCEFLGHVNKVHIYIYTNGWNENKRPSYSKDIGVHGDVFDEAEPTIKYLTDLLKESSLNVHSSMNNQTYNP